MGNNPTTAVPRPLNPKQPKLLGDLEFGPDVKEPLGGLNPHNPHFKTIGTAFYQLLIEHAGLHKHSHILDLGCGTGRLANALPDDINYNGFDINKRFVDYCVTTYPAKRFVHADLAHPEYNKTGTIDPLHYSLPYDNRTLDIVVAIALFNHLDSATVFHYVREISRILKPRGLLFATILLLNQQSMELINSRAIPPYSFSHRTPKSWHDFAERPLFNVAHPEEAIRRLCIQSKLMIREPIRYGEWCQSKVALTGHDILIAQKV
jgi:SAM-dependent methyltransferase